MSQLIYAGIGARETPLDVCSTMQLVGALLAIKGWTLRSGRAGRPVYAKPDTDSADLAFERGCDSVQGSKVIRIPTGTRPLWTDHAARFHPDWDRCDTYARHCHARNSAIILGDQLDEPVSFGICWTPGGAIVGGTGQALRIAAAYQIGMFNLAIDGHSDALWKYISAV